MITTKNLLLAFFILTATLCNAQIEADSTVFNRKHFLGTHAFMILTPLLDPSPEYYQLSYGYRLTSKDEISVEAITWAYTGPLGRQYGPDYESEESRFPGDIKAIGIGLAYKRLIWKGLFAQVHSTAFRQAYRDENKNTIQTGFQLFNTFRIGYHLNLGKQKRWFIAPSLAVTSWPINTNLPESFQVQEDKFPKYFLFEPGLHFGYTF